MTRIACGWRRAIAIAAFSTALAAPAYAQQSLGTVLRACGALDANRQLAVQATGFFSAATPVPVLAFVAALSLVSFGAMFLPREAPRETPA